MEKKEEQPFMEKVRKNLREIRSVKKETKLPAVKVEKTVVKPKQPPAPINLEKQIDLIVAATQKATGDYFKLLVNHYRETLLHEKDDELQKYKEVTAEMTQQILDGIEEIRQALNKLFIGRMVNADLERQVLEQLKRKLST